MAIRTSEQYIESLRGLKPKVYMGGEMIENIPDHPLFRAGINSIAQSYKIAQDPEYKDLATLISPVINERISRWTHIFQDEQDAIARLKLMRRGMEGYFCQCIYREVTIDALSTAWIVSYEIDKKYGTNYHRRVVEVVKQAQKNDWTIGLVSIDAKGNRSLRPSQQTDPDMYVRVVSRKADGIVIRGAKPHGTASAYSNLLCVSPSRPMLEDEKDYAVAFFVPPDAKGITFISRPSSMAPLHAQGIDCPLSSRLGQVESMVVFDDVFVPWEMVFLCGEYEFTGPYLDAITAYHILSKTGCRPASIDLSIGAVALIAEYNGIERASHIREYISEMIMDAQITYYIGIAGAVEGRKHESGAFIPSILAASIGKIYESSKFGRERYILQDAAGGSILTAASDRDYQNPATRKYMEKYLKGIDRVPAEDRIRLLKLIEDLIASESAGWYQGLSIIGGAAVQALKPYLRAEYDIEASKRRAKLAAGIKD